MPRRYDHLIDVGGLEWLETKMRHVDLFQLRTTMRGCGQRTGHLKYQNAAFKTCMMRSVAVRLGLVLRVPLLGDEARTKSEHGWLIVSMNMSKEMRQTPGASSKSTTLNDLCHNLGRK
jgi:hypothetical protein